MPLIPTTEAMKLLGYKDRYSFLTMIRRKRIPFAKLNRRSFRFDPAILAGLIKR
jgi:hypothetical protein